MGQWELTEETVPREPRGSGGSNNKFYMFHHFTHNTTSLRYNHKSPLQSTHVIQLLLTNNNRYNVSICQAFYIVITNREEGDCRIISRFVDGETEVQSLVTCQVRQQEEGQCRTQTSPFCLQSSFSSGSPGASSSAGHLKILNHWHCPLLLLFNLK